MDLGFQARVAGQEDAASPCWGDEFMDTKQLIIFGAAELPLMRVKAARGYVPGEISERIREIIGKEVQPPPLPATTA